MIRIFYGVQFFILILLMLRNVTKMPIVQMYYRVKMILILSPTGEIEQGA